MNWIEREKITIGKMIGLYCRGKEKNKVLCPECKCLLAYTHRKLDMCRYGNKKHTCKICQTHCYTPAYRLKIKEVMRYSGPRMLFYHPIAAIRHLMKL